MSFFDVRQYVGSKTVAGTLLRSGRTWRLPVDDTTSWRWRICDDLFVGDRIQLPDTDQPKDIWLRIAFSSGRLFRDGPRSWAYQIPARTGCPNCGVVAVHDITIPKARGSSKLYPFTRTCVDCTHCWRQDGTWPEPLRLTND